MKRITGEEQGNGGNYTEKHKQWQNEFELNISRHHNEAKLYDYQS